MRIFQDERAINFVDDQNVLVGYDYTELCCEDFGWMLSREAMPAEWEVGTHGIDPDGFQFVPDFLQEKSDESEPFTVYCSATFKLQKGEAVIYLHLWNHHNGYYGHGFTMTAEGKELHAGCL